MAVNFKKLVNEQQLRIATTDLYMLLPQKLIHLSSIARFSHVDKSCKAMMHASDELEIRIFPVTTSLQASIRQVFRVMEKSVIYQMINYIAICNEGGQSVSSRCNYNALGETQINKVISLCLLLIR